MLSNSIKNTTNSKRGGSSSITISDWFAKWGVYNMWASSNVLIDGTDTTFYDYNTTTPLDITNPTIAAQPTYNAASAFFSGKPSFTFDGTNHLMKVATSDYKGSDSSGVWIGVFRWISDVRAEFFSMADEGSLNDYMLPAETSTNRISLNVKGSVAATNNVIRPVTDTVSKVSGCVMSIGSKGSEYIVSENAVIKGIGATTGSNNGDWHDKLQNVDNIVIGGTIASIDLPANIEWCLTAYVPFTTNQDLVDMEADLMNIYKIGAIPKQYLFLGDSITVGHNATDRDINGFAQRFYSESNLPTNIYATSGAELFDYASDSTKVDATVVEIQRQLQGATNKVLTIHIGTNDFGLGSPQPSAATFGGWYADLLDAINLADSDIVVYCISPLLRSDDASLLDDYRTEISTECGTRSYATYIEGKTILDLADLDDGLHPTTAGHSKFKDSIFTTITF